MTKLLIINPNTTDAVTARIDALARAELGPAVQVRTVQAGFGARYIGSRAGVAIAGHAVLESFARALDVGAAPDAVVIACFGDPGLDALREIAAVPVFGFADSGLTVAAELPGRFAIATIGAAWGEMLGELVQRRGLADRFAGMIAPEENIRDAADVAQRIAAAATGIAASRIIVGGTGLIPAMAAITAALPLPVVDPHRATFRLALAAAAGSRTTPVPQRSSFVGLAPALQHLFGTTPAEADH